MTDTGFAQTIAALQNRVKALEDERIELLWRTHREYDDNPGVAWDNRRELARAIAKQLKLTDAETKAITLHPESVGSDIITALVDYLRGQVKKAEDERNQLAHFNPNWDMLRATQDSLREHQALLRQAYDTTVPKGMEWLETYAKTGAWPTGRSFISVATELYGWMKRTEAAASALTGRP